MRVLDKVRLRLRSLFRRRNVEGELDAELRFHLDQQIEENLASGMAPQEARVAAMRTIGGIVQFQEECRDMRRINLMENLGRDLRFGLRAMHQSPAFTTVAVLTLALGIGANTAIFSVVYAALLRPLPYQEPDRLITLGESRLQQQTDSLSTGTWNASNPDFLDWKSQSKAFQSLAGFVGDGFIMKGLGEPELVVGVQSTVNFLSVLGVKPVLGRDFAPGEDTADGPNVCILSYGFWRNRFGGDAHAIGRSIQLGNNSVRIIGVPRGV
jgi:putative ABC transport system permease protein